MALLFKFLHIASVLWFVSGALLIQALAIIRSRSQHLVVVAAAQRAIAVANRIFVLTGFLLVLTFGLATAIAEQRDLLQPSWLSAAVLLFVIAAIPGLAYHLPASRRITRLIEAASRQGQITPGLRTAIQSPLLMWMGYFQIALFIIILALMVFKPF